MKIIWNHALCAATLSLAGLCAAQTGEIAIVDNRVRVGKELPIERVLCFIAQHGGPNGFGPTVVCQNPLLDDFPGNIKFERRTYDLPSFIKVVSGVQSASVYGPNRETKMVALYNPEPLSVGEIQWYEERRGFFLKAREAKLTDIADLIRQLTGVTVVVPIPLVEVSDTLTLEAKKEEDLIKAFTAWMDDKLEAPKVATSWPLTFTSSGMISHTTSFTLPAYDQTTANLLAEAFNIQYGEKTVVAAGANTLLIRAPKKTAFAIKEALAKWIDVPYDQVQLSVWVLNASQSKDAEKRLADRIGLLRRGVAIARNYQKLIVGDLEMALRTSTLNRDLEPSLLERLVKSYPAFGLGNPLSSRKVSFETLEIERNAIRPPIEQLAFIPFLNAPCFEAKLNSLRRGEDFLNEARKEICKSVEIPATFSPREKRELEADVKISKDALIKLIDSLLLSAKGRNFSLMASFVKGCGAKDADTLLRYLEAYKLCSYDVAADCRVDPETLSLTASSADALIGNTIDAVTTDVRRMVVDPLQMWITKIAAQGEDGKSLLSFGGQTTINVTSSMNAGTWSIAEQNLPYTPPTSPTKEIVEGIVGDLSGQALTSSAGALGLVKALASLTPNPTKYTKISTGLGLSVRPTVLPGGRGARLQIGVVATPNTVKDSGDFDEKSARIDGLTSQEMLTDVQVDAFDLFELSTLNMQHTGPGDYRWQIPFLDGLPLVGGMFRGPRTTRTTIHRSVVLVQVSIIPKSLQITRRYDNR